MSEGKELVITSSLIMRERENLYGLRPAKLSFLRGGLTGEALRGTYRRLLLRHQNLREYVSRIPKRPWSLSLQNRVYLSEAKFWTIGSTTLVPTSMTHILLQITSLMCAASLLKQSLLFGRLSSTALWYYFQSTRISGVSYKSSPLGAGLVRVYVCIALSSLC
jgi:hypothetical protein